MWTVWPGPIGLGATLSWKPIHAEMDSNLLHIAFETSALWSLRNQDYLDLLLLNGGVILITVINPRFGL